MRLLAATWTVFLVAALVRAGTCGVVGGAYILGRDLAAAAPELAALEPSAEIAPAPLAGVERVFHTQELARIAREHAIAVPGHTLEICFVRKTILLTPERLIPAMQQALGANRTEPPAGSAAPTGVHLEILDFSRYPVPEGTLEFPRGALAASGLWHGRVLTADGRSTPVWARVRVTDAATGAPVPMGPAAGSREVNRGDPVLVEVWSGRAVVAFDSVAESSGRKGEMVLVVTPDKRRRLLARVEDKGKVSITK